MIHGCAKNPIALGCPALQGVPEAEAEAYLMTFGVERAYRRLGLGSLLLKARQLPRRQLGLSIDGG